MPRDPRSLDAAPPPGAADRRHDPSGSWWRRRPHGPLLVALLTVGAMAGLAGVAFASIYVTADIPPPDQLTPPGPSIVYDAQGEEVGSLDPAAIRRNVDLADLPAHVPQAVLAAEDRGFRDHGGFSVGAIVRAAWANLTSGSVVQGASTINQQYVELAIADVDDSLPGKFREVAIAAKLDDTLSKDDILEMYLNAVPFEIGRAHV